jgi:hypothetical protein
VRRATAHTEPAFPVHYSESEQSVKFLYAFPKNALALLFESVLRTPTETWCKLYYRSSRDYNKDRVLMILVPSLGPTETTKAMLERAKEALEDELGYYLVKQEYRRHDARTTPHN